MTIRILTPAFEVQTPIGPLVIRVYDSTAIEVKRSDGRSLKLRGCGRGRVVRELDWRYEDGRWGRCGCCQNVPLPAGFVAAVEGWLKAHSRLFARLRLAEHRRRATNWSKHLKESLKW